MSDSFRLYLLGGFRLEKNGARVQLYSRKVESLLAYLALYPQEHSREKLAALLWGDSTDEQARGSLRRALNNLRQQLGAEALLTDRDTVQLNPDFPLWVDAREFRRMTLHASGQAPDEGQIPSDESFISLYQGDLLADFYDDWIFPLREEYRAQYLDALVRSIEQARAASEYAEAIGLAQRILALDRAHEEAHQHLMFCYAAMGNRSAALEQYETCRIALRDDLGVEPSKETRALYASIQKKETGSRAARLTNLPKPLTSFVGREQQLAELGQLVMDSRLVTLTGAGGSGKTRLAIQLGHQLYEQYADGVWFVDFAPLTDSELVPQQVAKTLSVQEQPQRAVTETLIQFLENKALLLILDNCEHLINACAVLAETLVTQCGMLHVLATSREPLGIGGENVWRVPTLAVPPAQEFSEWLLQYEAVRLFVERARMLTPRFALNEQNASAVARICQRLDGIPLAIELAAARTNVLSPEQIAARLDDRFGLLTSGSRTAQPRQQTLRGLIDWSYDLLSENERVLLRRLSVFAGGWTLEAAEALMAGVDAATPDFPTAETHFHLVDKSLVIVEEHAVEKRFRMLESIREYAREKLLESGELKRVQDVHLEIFLRLADALERHLYSGDQSAALNRFDAEHDNFRIALEWSSAIDKEPGEQSLWLAGALQWFWYLRNHWGEGRIWYDRVLKKRDSLSVSVKSARVKALNGSVLLAIWQSDFGRADDLANESLALSQELGDARNLGIALGNLAYRANMAGDYHGGIAHARQAIIFLRQVDDYFHLAWALNTLGFALLRERDIAGSIAVEEEQLEISKKTGNAFGHANALMQLGGILKEQGDYGRAEPLLQEVLALNQKLDNRPRIAETLAALAESALYNKEYARAIALCEESAVIMRDLDYRAGLSWVLDLLGIAASRVGQYARALDCFRSSLSIHQQRQYQQGMLETLTGLSGVTIGEGSITRGVKLLGAIETLLNRFGTGLGSAELEEYDRNVAIGRAKLDPSSFARAWAEGRALTLEQAIEYALSELT